MILFITDLDRRTRVDLFVADHIEALNIQLTLAISKAIKWDEEDEVEENEKEEKEVITVHSANATENLPKKKKETVRNKDRNANSILIPQIRSHINRQVPLLPNGSELQRRNKSIVVTNTCAFDSLVSVYGALYLDNSIMREKIEESYDEFASFIKLLLTQKTIDSKIEYARYVFLKDIYPDGAVQELNDLTNFSCQTAIAGLFRAMCEGNSDILSSRTRIVKCSRCGKEESSECPFVNYLYDDFDFSNVQESIVAEKTRVCGECSTKTAAIENEFHDIVVIDCEPMIESQRKLTNINAIQNRIQLNGIEYELFACIQYDDSLKHFIPHIKRKVSKWETYDDLNRTRTDTNTNEQMFIYLMLYSRKSNGMCIKQVIECVYVYLFYI